MAPGLFCTVTAILATLVQAPDPHAHHRPAPTPVESGWVIYRHRTSGFSLEHPADWTVDKRKVAVSIHIAHPTRPVHLYASAFMLPGGTLRDFAELKFGAQADLFKPLGPRRAMEGVGWSGLVQDAEATQSGERIRRRVLCAKHEGLYVSLALYLDPKTLAAPDVDYDRLFTSLRFDAGAARPTPMSATGCLEKGDEVNAFQLTHVTSGSDWKLVDVPATLKMLDHVGHKVEVSGTPLAAGDKTADEKGISSGTGSGAAKMKNKKDGRRLRVTSMKHVAATCP